jgi:sugar phosphate isomerase/epimerase
MKLGLFSVSYAGYWGQHKLSLPEFIAKSAELGYDAVMLAGKRPHLSPLDADVSLVKSIRAALEQHSIACGVVAAYTDLSPAAAAEVPYLEMQIAYVESLAKLASELRAPIVRVFTAYETASCPTGTLWNGVVRALQEMCERAELYGVTLAVQNHHDLGVHSDALVELLQDINRPNCKLAFDAWSPALRGEDLYEAGKKMAAYSVMTTNADYVRLPRFRYQPELINYRRAEPDLVRAVKFGTGFIDFPAFFRGLKDGGFDGYYNYEMCSPIRGGGDIVNLDDYSTHYVRWMHEHA